MAKTAGIVGAVTYALGASVYFIAYVATYWGGGYSTGAIMLDGVKGGAIWPYLIYDWLINGAALM